MFSSLASSIERIGLKALHKTDPERAHQLALLALNCGLVPKRTPFTTARLRTQVAGLDLANPIGLAAGFDKNATALHPLSKTGFGFLEVGAITPKAQPGNPKPRLFRLTQDQAVINRFGFNNEGMEAAKSRLEQRPSGVIGLNLGANKTSENRAADFAQVLSHCGEHLDFATVNVSSPNTEKLRDLQGKAALSALLNGVMDSNQTLTRPLPIFLKIAPDLQISELEDIAEIVNEQNLSGIIATNTTLKRDGLNSPHKGEQGGLSGTPLFEMSTRVVAQLTQWTDKPIIGVGGIASAQDAYQKIKAGAHAVQLYSALVYHGISLPHTIAKELDVLLKNDGYTHIKEAIGVERNLWL